MEPKVKYEPKRYYRRVPLGIYAKAKLKTCLLPFNFTNNVSLGGMFITTGNRSPVEFQIAKGAPVQIQFMLPNSTDISDIDGEVIWLDTCLDLNNKYLTYGIGLRFTTMTRKTEKCLMNIVGFPSNETETPPDIQT